MCIALPKKIIKINNPKTRATIIIGDSPIEIDISLLEGLEIGDYVIVQSGIAVQKVDEDDAKESMDLWESLSFREEKID
ncbi:MAG: HypC/HybG/HupF family hydrogenase formation chaperone [Candidatus Heimdallarchaeota archaeon]|nr:HypC/HybG/HupF family hydrogenase formation chaperone [Candidatus Heimdallarchaeota archaeon]